MTSLRALAIPDLVADPEHLKRLIAEGETLFVERKARDPKDGLGPTVASFANMLGGWLLIGVDDDGNVVGYDPPGTADLQDYIRDLLRTQVDPLPPFAAVSVPVGDETIGVVRVAESSDQPHITSDGVIYVRNPGGKHRVTDHRDVLEMARRGEEARTAAGRRQYTLSVIEAALKTPSRIFGDEPGTEHRLPPLVQWIIRATPYTVTGRFADRALCSAAADLAAEAVTSLFPEPTGPPQAVATRVDARARGLRCVGEQQGSLLHADMAIDAGGVVAARLASRRGDHPIELQWLASSTLEPLIRAVANALNDLDGYGRAAIGLQVRGALGLTVRWSGTEAIGTPTAEHLDGHERLHVGGDLAVPTTDDEVSALALRWVRELARASGMPMWEPAAADLPDS